MKLQNKKLILGFASVALLGSSLFANTYEQKTQMPKEMMFKHFYIKTIPTKHHNNYEDKIISKIMMLDLSANQYKQIQEILQRGENLLDPLDAFSQNEFDKDKFIKSIQTNKQTKLEEKAEKISKVYAVLTKEQKKDLRTILDMQEIMQKKLKQLHKQEFQG